MTAFRLDGTWLNGDAPPQDAQGAPARALPLFNASALAGKPIPPRAWLVPDLVPARTVTLLSGNGGVGKSLLALQLSAAAAAGRSWIGREVTAGRALFLSAEDEADELHRRLADIARAEGLDLADLDNLTLASLAGEDAVLGAPAPGASQILPTRLYHALDHHVGEIGPALVVLDTSADLFGGNENDRVQVRQFVGLLKRLALRHDTTVVLLAHPSRAGMATGTGDSGSTAWNGSVRSRLYLTEAGGPSNESADPDARTLTTKKANYGPNGGEIQLRWREGVFVPDDPETGLDRMAKTARAQRVFLKLLVLHASQGRNVNVAGGQMYAPNVFAKHPENEGCTKHAFRTAMEALLASKAIENVETGSPSRRRSHLVVVEK